MDIENTISDAEIIVDRILVQNEHIHITDEERGDNLTNKCLTADVRETGFYLKGWRAGCYIDVDANPVSGSAVEIYRSSEGLEIDFVLGSIPSTNTFSFAIDSHNLDYFYQPALTQDEIDAGDERPENVVGSYAVYYSNKQHDFTYPDGTAINYGTGKFCHILRPYAEDAVGNKVWCDLNIDTDASILSVSVPQEFLDTAVYPVRVDPIFGKTTIGGTTTIVSQNNQGACRKVMSSDTNAYAKSITMYTRSNTGTATGALWALYNNTPSTPNALLDTAPHISINSIAAWKTATLAGRAALTASATYWLCLVPDMVNAVRVYYDAGSAGDWQQKTAAGTTWTDPWGTTSLSLANNVSIYCTYLVAETVTIQSNATIKGTYTATINSAAKIYGLKTIQSNATIKGLKTVSSDARVYGLSTVSITSNAIIKGTYTATINSDATIKVSDTQTINSNGHIQVSETSTINSDAVVEYRNDINSDATIYGLVSINSDATIYISESTTIDSDAVVEYRNDINSDAVILRSDVTTIQSDARAYQPLNNVPEFVQSYERVRGLTPADISGGIRIF